MKIKDVKEINIKIRNVILSDKEIDRLIRDYDNYTASCSSNFKKSIIGYTYKYMSFEKIWNKFILPNTKPSVREKMSDEDKDKLIDLIFNNDEIKNLIDEQNKIIESHKKMFS